MSQGAGFKVSKVSHQAQSLPPHVPDGSNTLLAVYHGQHFDGHGLAQ